MTISQSGLTVAPIKNSITGGTQANLIAVTNRFAVYTNSLVPDFSASNPLYGSAPYTTGEVTDSAAVYVAGGKVIGTLALVESPASSGILKWSGDDVEWLATTINGIAGGIVYAPSLSGLVLAIIKDPLGPQDTNSGRLAVEWDALGIADWDLVP